MQAVAKTRLALLDVTAIESWDLTSIQTSSALVHRYRWARGLAITAFCCLRP